MKVIGSPIWLLTLVVASCATGVHAAGSEFYGPLRMRDLTPFGFLRLDMRPAHAVAMEPRTWAFEAELGYQNTWAMSPEVEQYLNALEPQGRRPLGPAELQAIRNLPGENYLVDMESALLDLNLHYKFSKRLSGFFIASVVSYRGGFLDGGIEVFHEAFGFSNFGRPAVRRNDVNILYDLKSVQYASFGAPIDGGLMDPTLGLRYAGFTLPGEWSLVVEGAIQIPVAGRRELLSTGRANYGVQLSLQRRRRHHAWYLDLAGVYYAGADSPVPEGSRVIPTLILGYERRLGARTNLNLQGYVSQSVYSHRQTDLDELRGGKYQLSAGVRHRTGNLLLSFGVTENLQNFNNTPDVGFQLGLAYVPARIRPAGITLALR